MADYVVVYNSSTLFVFAAFSKSTSDNVSTWKTDGHLTVDGTKHIDSIESLGSNVEAVVLTDPTNISTNDPPGVFEVDVHPTPTDVTERTDTAPTGSKTKDQLYVAP